MTPPDSFTCLRVLANTPYLTSSSLCEIVSTFGTEARVADSLEEAVNEDGAVLVITNTPAYVLAAYLQSAPDMGTGLARWVEWAEDLLRHQRRGRRKFTLVDLELLTRGNAEDFDLVKVRLGRALSRLPVSFATSRPQSALLLLATVSINAHHRAASLAQELEVAMFSPTDETSTIDLTERVLADLRHNDNELSLQREIMALQVGEIERHARLLIAAEQKSREIAEASSATKQKQLQEFSQLLGQILHKKDLMRLPWASRRAWQISIVRDCGVVDPDWYLQRHQDVANAGVDPFEHYIEYGVREGRPPNTNFL